MTQEIVGRCKLPRSNPRFKARRFSRVFAQVFEALISRQGKQMDREWIFLKKPKPDRRVNQPSDGLRTRNCNYLTSCASRKMFRPWWPDDSSFTLLAHLSASDESVFDKVRAAFVNKSPHHVAALSNFINRGAKRLNHFSLP